MTRPNERGVKLAFKKSRYLCQKYEKAKYLNIFPSLQTEFDSTEVCQHNSLEGPVFNLNRLSDYC